MAAISTYPTDARKLNEYLVRGDPVAIPVVINDPDNDTPVGDREWRAHIRSRPDGPLIVAFTIDFQDDTTLVLRLTAEQSKLLKQDYTWDVEEVGVRTWWIVTKCYVQKDVSHG